MLGIPSVISSGQTAHRSTIPPLCSNGISIYIAKSSTLENTWNFGNFYEIYVLFIRSN